jgi:hypothetical protein
LWERRLRVFKNRVLRRIFEHKDKVNGSGEDYITRSLVICTPYQIFRDIKSRIKRAGHAACKGDRNTVFWWGELREIDHLEDLGT